MWLSGLIPVRANGIGWDHDLDGQWPSPIMFHKRIVKTGVYLKGYIPKERIEIVDNWLKRKYRRTKTTFQKAISPPRTGNSHPGSKKRRKLSQREKSRLHGGQRQMVLVVDAATGRSVFREETNG